MSAPRRTGPCPSSRPRAPSCAPNCASAKTSCSVLTDKLAEADRALEKRALELEKLGRLYDDASFSSSNRQIELVARESEVEKLSSDVSSLRNLRKEADKRVQDLDIEMRAAREAREGREEEDRRSRKEARAHVLDHRRPRRDASIGARRNWRSSASG